MATADAGRLLAELAELARALAPAVCRRPDRSAC